MQLHLLQNTQRKGAHAPVTLPHKADSTREDPPAAHRLQQEAVSCSLWPCCTSPDSLELNVPVILPGGSSGS
ncbi:hypothetical protein CgunFtcFv8_012076 [Champsocephalus gunnari]|uniref:Uncharacterized protein n=1 Tax=Champsocephalus gunnari TaxID=52237 RepID=A0AAN8HIN3_CHAGU|nr:hypothetical protein CgunFtcFv8_012076 [Champsocephalus gunnari]